VLVPVLYEYLFFGSIPSNKDSRERERERERARDRIFSIKTHTNIQQQQLMKSSLVF
jgi:hypothetical protein